MQKHPVSMAFRGRLVNCLKAKLRLSNQINAKEILSQHQVCRTMFSAEILGIDGFKKQQFRCQEKIGEHKDKYFNRMEEYLQSSERNTVFTDDLNTIVHLVENEQDLSTAVKMMKSYHLQNQDLRFSSFRFGPCVMRMLHIMQMPGTAFDFLMSEEMSGFFDQLASYVVTMDLLFECEQYEKVLEAMDYVKDKQIAGLQYPMDCVTLTSAACLKLNTEESLEKLLHILRECKRKSLAVSLRSYVHGSLLALLQNKPDVAVDIFTMYPQPPGEDVPVAYRNMKLLLCAKLGRHEEAIGVLKEALWEDDPSYRSKRQSVFPEIFSELKSAILEAENKELAFQVESLEKHLKTNDQFHHSSFEDYLFRTIFRKRAWKGGFKQNKRRPQMRDEYRP